MLNANTLKILVLIVCVLRGLLVPDFRYGYVSIGLIQVLFPLTIAAMCYVALRSDSLLSAGKLGMAAIVFAQLVAIATYVAHVGVEQLDDPVTLSIFLASFVAQAAVFLFALIAASLSRRSSN